MALKFISKRRKWSYRRKCEKKEINYAVIRITKDLQSLALLLFCVDYRQHTAAGWNKELSCFSRLLLKDDYRLAARYFTSCRTSQIFNLFILCSEQQEKCNDFRIFLKHFKPRN